jgi:acyl carrier protein
MESTTDIKAQIKQFIVETTNAPAADVKDDTLIFVQGFFDSMGFLLLISFIEEQFGVKTDDSELLEENFESINAIAGFIERKKNS